MADNTIKKKVTSGLIWTYLERFLAQGVTLIVSIVLARLLVPENYGVIAIVQVFISIANVFMSDGFGNALIQKKNSDSLDFSTVMYFSVGYSLVLYMILFFTAPFIADYYNMPEITPIIRVMAIRLPIAGINTVQKAVVSKSMHFKKFFFATLGGTIISAIVGIAMAYFGFGAWAIVGQYLTNTVIDTIWLACTIGWHPKLEYSWKRMKQLFCFGWKLLATSLLTTAYSQSRSLFIGKKYTSTDLAFVTKGEQFPSLISVNINSSITSVLFPALALCQDDKTRLKQLTRRSVQISMFLLTPILVGFASVASEVIKIILTDKWIECVPYVQIYCLVYLLQPIQTAELQCMKATGRSDLNFKLQIIESSFGIAVIFVSVFCFHSILIIVLSALITEIFATVVNFPVSKKLINYKLGEQLMDVIVPLIIAGVMFLAVSAVGVLSLSIIVGLLIKIITGMVVYILLSLLFQRELLYYTVSMVLSLLKVKRG